VKNIKLQGDLEIPTLEQALDLCHKKVKLLLVELKKVWSLVSLLVLLKSKVEPRDIAVISFHKDLVAGISFLAPEVETALITALPLPDPVKLAKSALAKGIAVRFPFIDMKLVERARADKLSVFVWDCPDIKAAQKTMKLDIDGIITDFPDLVKGETG
jgi:glycerophosphoryl diester phosphodiesterase